MKVDSQWKEQLEKQKDLVRTIYEAMEDECSKKTYENLLRLQYTGKVEYLMEAVRLNGFEPDPALTCYNTLQEWAKQGIPLILYGLGGNAEDSFRVAQEKYGQIGYLFFPFITDIPWSGYCDKYRRGTFGPDEKEIMTPADMVARFPNAMICVSALAAYEEIKKELIALGAAEERICRYIPGETKVFEDKQYFGENFMPPKKEKYFVDGGAYRFDTAERFLRWNQEFGVEGVFCFEPDPENYDVCCSRLQSLPDASIRQKSRMIHAGVSDRNAVLSFFASGNDESHFIEGEGNVSIPLVSIDTAVDEKDVSMLKLDVEGFELQALQGAEKTIRRCCPRMAVCAYHKLEDLLKIPQWILDLDMGYKLWLRMYSNEYLEIVLYAVPEKGGRICKNCMAGKL